MRCGGRFSVISTVSMSQPNSRLRVDHAASPLSIFLTEAGSLQVGGSPGSTGLKTVTMAWSVVCKTRS